MMLTPSKISIEKLSFRPPNGLSSPFLQTVLPFVFSKAGKESPFTPFLVTMEDGDSLYCKMATPLNWKENQKTILLLHGLGGSDSSEYMVRLSTKFYRKGYRVVRVNLRGTGQGTHFAQRPYHAGLSQDILSLIQTLKQHTPHSPIVLIGYSLGGNVALKLLGELGDKGSDLIKKVIAICAPIDLERTMQLLCKNSNRLFHQYYVQRLKKIGARWIGKHAIKSLLDFDNLVTASQWGYRDAFDYYHHNSSLPFLPSISQNCHLIFAEDDPFVDYRLVLDQPLSSTVKIWLSPYGGHMGFWGWAGKEHGFNWLDALLLKLTEDLH